MDSLLFYKKYGSGSENLLCFHGFGQDHRLWTEYVEQLSIRYTIFSFDIFYHGQSQREESLLTFDEWRGHIRTIIAKENIETFSILGFSLGGRFSLACLKEFPDRIHNIILLAPDGIHKSFWYRLATSKMGNHIFKVLMYANGGFDKFIFWVERMGLVSMSLLKFAKLELSTPENRDRVYKTWTFFKTLQVPSSQWKKALMKSNSDMYIILGSQDSIVRPQDIKPKVDDTKRLTLSEIDAKHHQIVEKAKISVINILTQPDH